MVNKSITTLAAGDIILGEDPEKFFSSVGPVLDTADIRVGQLEVPYSNSAPELADLNLETDNLKPIAKYFDLISLAGNHIYDAKETGVYETVNWLDYNSVPYFGGGRNIVEARRPVIIDKEGTRVGFLSYNCTGPKIMTAGPEKAGCAKLDIITHYELGDVANPGGTPSIINSWPEPKSFSLMLAEISDLKKSVMFYVFIFTRGLFTNP